MTETGRERFEREVPPFCSQHQVIKSVNDPDDSKRTCALCKSYWRGVDTECFDCLQTEHLDLFEPREIGIVALDWSWIISGYEPGTAFVLLEGAGDEE